MDYQESLKTLRDQLFAPQQPTPVDTPKTGFIPTRATTPTKTAKTEVQKSLAWLKEIKAASEEVLQAGKNATKPIRDLMYSAPSYTPTPEEKQATLIARRGDGPSLYAPRPSKMGTPVNFEGDWGRVAEAVKGVESNGGDYSIRGPVVDKGPYKGQSAMGAYQIMPGNLPSWSKAALGREVTEEEFMSSPEIQDAIFLDRMKKAMDKYGSIEDAVSVWFTGHPVRTDDTSSDGYITATQYINKFQDFYNYGNK